MYTSIQRADWRALSKRDPMRVVFRIAARANGDTIMGGCSALVLAERAKRMRLPMGRDMLAAVHETYALSLGRTPDDCTPWECCECGSIHTSQGDALRCCAEQEEPAPCAD